MTVRYNFANIRTLLTEGFNDKELRRICYDVPEFKPVYDQLAENTGKAEIVDRLVEYADQRLQVETLLDLAKERNLTRYQKHKPYYDEIGQQKKSGTHKKNQRNVQGTEPFSEPDTGLIEERVSLQSELLQHRRNLNLLREQAAIFAAGETPLHILNQMEAEEAAIRTIEERLSELKNNDH